MGFGIVFLVLILLGIIGNLLENDQESAPVQQITQQSVEEVPVQPTTKQPAEDAIAQTKAKQPAEEVIVVGVEELCDSYKQNEIAADKKYKGKFVKVTGNVSEIKKDILDKLYVTLMRKNDFEFSHPQFYFHKKYEDELSNLKKGQRVTIIGRVDGLFMNVLIKEARLVD